MEFQPFTYYRNVKEERVFLLVECPTDLCPNAPIALIEWGKTREQPVWLSVTHFSTLVSDGSMQLFTPKYYAQ